MTPSIFRELTRMILGMVGGVGCVFRGRDIIICLDFELLRVRLLEEAQVEIRVSSVWMV